MRYSDADGGYRYMVRWWYRSGCLMRASSSVPAAAQRVEGRTHRRLASRSSAEPERVARDDVALCALLGSGPRRCRRRRGRCGGKDEDEALAKDAREAVKVLCADGPGGGGGVRAVRHLVCVSPRQGVSAGVRGGSSRESGKAHLAGDGDDERRRGCAVCGSCVRARVHS